MTIVMKRFTKGIVLKGESTDVTENLEGSLFHNDPENRLKAYIEGAVRQIVTNSQSQTLTNKTIDVDNNTLSNIETDNLKSGVLNTSTTLSGASDTQIPSALAVKTYIDNGLAGQNDASEITVSPAVNGKTNVQAALEDHETRIDTAESHIASSTNVHGLAVGSSVVGTTDSQSLSNKTLTGASIQTPIRSDVKQGTLASLVTYAATATNGQIVYATDEKAMYQVVDGDLVGIGGAGIVKLTAGENISAFDLVYISTGTGNDSGRIAGRVYKVDASNDDRVEVAGFAPKAITSGAIGEVQVSGNLKGFTGLTPGKVYYASASIPGAITLIAPSTNGQWVISVCLASTSSEIVINPVSSASAIYVIDNDISFTIANNQATTNVTGLLFDGISTRSFILDYSIYRKTDTAASALAQVGQLRGVYNTQTSTWFMSDDYSGQNAGVTFSILTSGQIRYSSTNIAGANYSGTLKYNIRKTFGV
jgi:hypothetical protein